MLQPQRWDTAVQGCYHNAILAGGRRRELNVTVVALDDPSYVFTGSASVIKLPENAIYKYISSVSVDPVSGATYPARVVQDSVDVLHGTVYVLSNKTDASGQRLEFTMSRCIADGNPLGFCERLRSSTSALFVA